MASAAAVAGGIPAQTFNAAGLHIDTLYQPGGQVERYAGSVARYNNASAFIDAYFVDWDLLSLLQDHSLLPMPSAIGDRIVLDGPHDFQVAVTIAMLLASANMPWSTVFANLYGGYYARDLHYDHCVLHGLLVDEGAWDVLGYNL